MKGRFYILFNTIFIFFLLQNIISFGQQKTVLAQSKTGLGEGIVVITLYSADSQNYKHIDTTTVPNFKLKTAYFIKGNMILRPYMKGNMFLLEGEDLSVPKDTVYKKENLGEAELKTSLSAWISNPKYLIDWKRKKYYTSFSKDRKPHASVYSESEQHFEFFYTIRKPDTTSFKILSLDETKSFMISGFNCYHGVGISRSDTLYFAYTKDLIKIKSPLNLTPFFKNFPYDVISFSGPSSGSEGRSTDSTYVVTRRWPTLVTITITYLKERKLEDSLFKIPKGTIIVKNLSNKEIQNYENIERAKAIEAVMQQSTTTEPTTIEPTTIEVIERETTTEPE